MSSSASSPGTTARRPSLAVFDVETKNIDEATGAVLSEVLTSAIDALGTHDVISQREIASMLDVEQQKQLLGCDDASCVAALGGALGADQIVISQVGKVGSTYVVTLKLINVREVRTDKRISEQVKGQIDDVLATVRRSVRSLFGLAPADEPATASTGAKATDKSGEPTTATKSGGGGIPIIPIIVAVLGLGGVGAGAAFGVMAQGDNSLANDPTRVGSQAAIARGQQNALIANIMFGAGGGVAALGAVLFFVLWDRGGDQPAPASAAPASASLHFAPWLSADGAGAIVSIGGF